MAHEWLGLVNSDYGWLVLQKSYCVDILRYMGFSHWKEIMQGKDKNWKVMWPKPSAKELYKFPEWKQEINARFQPHMVVKIFKGKFQEAKILLFPL